MFAQTTCSPALQEGSHAMVLSRATREAEVPRDTLVLPGPALAQLVMCLHHALAQ